MRFPALLTLIAMNVCAMAQAPVPKPPVPTPAPTPVPTVTSPEGVSMPLQFIQPGPSLPPDRVVIQVGEVQLNAGQIDQILDAYPENQRVFVNGPGRALFIDQLVRVLLLSQEGKRRKLDQTDLYRNQLAYSSAGILTTHTDEDIRKNVKIDDAMLQGYLRAHPLDYMQLRASHILVRMKDSPLPLLPGQPDLTETEALAKAQEIRKKIVEGADFAQLAGAESSDMVSRVNGGDVGFFKRGQMLPSFEEVAFALKAGEISQPVKTSLGYELIRLEEVKPVKSFDELRPELDRNLRNELARKYVQDLKALTRIEIDPEFLSSTKSMSTAKPPQ